MMPLAADYLAAIAAQIASLGAFLGGFAATFLALFLTHSSRSRAASIAVVASALSAVSFILAVVAATALIAVLHPHAPQGAIVMAPFGRKVMSLGFLLGMIALLTAIGASGWTRSRALGWTTSAFAAVAILLAPTLLR